MRRRGQAALLAVAMLSLAVLAYLYAVSAARVSIVYHGEAEWMALLATARHSLATNTSLDTLMARLKPVAARQGVWLPPVDWAASYRVNATGWSYRADFYNSTLGFRGWFYAGASYTLLGTEYDSLGSLWLVYNLSYIHLYKIPELAYPVAIYPEPLNTSCSRVYRAGEGEWIVRLRPPCVVRDKWGIAVLGVP